MNKQKEYLMNKQKLKLQTRSMEDVEKISILNVREYQNMLATVPNIPVETSRQQVVVSYNNNRLSLLNKEGDVIGLSPGKFNYNIRPVFMFIRPLNLPAGTLVYVDNIWCRVIDSKRTICEDLYDANKEFGDAFVNVSAYNDVKATVEKALTTDSFKAKMFDSSVEDLPF